MASAGVCKWGCPHRPEAAVLWQTIHTTTLIDAPPEVVWEVTTVIHRYRERGESLHHCPRRRPPRQGTPAHHLYAGGPQARTFTPTVTALEPRRSSTDSGAPVPVAAYATTWIATPAVEPLRKCQIECGALSNSAFAGSRSSISPSVATTMQPANSSRPWFCARRRRIETASSSGPAKPGLRDRPPTAG